MTFNISIKGTRKFWNFSPGFIGINLVIALAITLLSDPSCMADLNRMRGAADDLLLAFLLSTTLSYGGFLIESYYDDKLSWIQYPLKRLVLESASYFIYVFCASLALIFLFTWLVTKSFTLNNIPWKQLVLWTKFPMQIAFFISFVFISRSFLMEWRKAAIEAEQLKTERFARQYQSLKDQLNPHFLFNSLNVLSNLVYENPDTAAKFVHRLSRIYRYVLDVQHEELVSLEKELDFAADYLSLQKIRFEDSLQYEIRIDQNTSGNLPPLSLQLLLENAIKHNIASTENPLRIGIFMENQELVVKNNLQLKSSMPENSAGIGLMNIVKRYELLSNQTISIQDTGGSFVVKLPLLEIPEQQKQLFPEPRQTAKPDFRL
ncbi:sensor histidine kinase [Dyadobacter flavalbus]|uniref:sensor histidine kinase n=1 Tax=Dyadobacter flavalbus TaxID=2579942 RepID=UPI001E503F25|nr:histidine kinase [Dyadobacter flavalbus]